MSAKYLFFLTILNIVYLVSSNTVSSEAQRSKAVHLPEIGFKGYVPVKMGIFFYWGFYAHKDADDVPLCLWLPEGPGVSILIPIFEGNGPYKFISEQNIEPNPYAWNRKVNMLYVETPLGTGLSKRYKPLRDSHGSFERENESLVEFLFEFLKLHPEFNGRELIIGGESSGSITSIFLGHWFIKSDSKKPNLKFKGQYLNSPMLKLDDQYAYTPKFLYKNKRITKKRYQELKLVMDLWKSNIQSEKFPFTIYQNQMNFFLTKNNHSFIQTRGDVKTDVLNLTYFMNSAVIDFLYSDVMASFYPLHTWNEVFQLQNLKIQNHFNSGIINQNWDFTTKLAEIIDHNMGEFQVTIVNGNLDMISPTKVILKLQKNLKWYGHQGFADAKWQILGKTEKQQEYQNLRYHFIDNGVHPFMMLGKKQNYSIFTEFLYQSGQIARKPKGPSKVTKIES